MSVNTKKNDAFKKPLKIWGIAILVVAALIAILTVSGAGKFAYSTARCGQLPVESTKWAAAYSYKLPGDAGYGIHMVSDYKFCTESEINATNGYYRAN